MRAHSHLSGHWPGILLYLGDSRIDGRGLFTSGRILARVKIGEFAGELISRREARGRARRSQKIAIVELDDGRALDATRAPNWFRYINHSCSSNAYMRIYRQHVEFYARREIQPGEEITCDYGESHHNGTLPCKCRSAGCRGFI
jgi:SET domain-containing protein